MRALRIQQTVELVQPWTLVDTDVRQWAGSTNDNSALTQFCWLLEKFSYSTLPLVAITDVVATWRSFEARPATEEDARAGRERWLAAGEQLVRLEERMAEESRVSTKIIELEGEVGAAQEQVGVAIVERDALQAQLAVVTANLTKLQRLPLDLSLSHEEGSQEGLEARRQAVREAEQEKHDLEAGLAPVVQEIPILMREVDQVKYELQRARESYAALVKC